LCAQVRFTPKFEGDTSAEEWVEAHLRRSKPHLDKVRARDDTSRIVCARVALLFVPFAVR
jgi:hypothetical protein